MSAWFRKAAAAALFLVAGFMLLGFSLSEQKNSVGVTIFSLLLTVAFPIMVGIGLLRGTPGANSARLQQLREQTIDSEILRLAIERKGRLTVVEIASALGLADGDINKSIDGMMRREIADVEVTDDGVLVYTFHDAQHMPSAESKKRLFVSDIAQPTEISEPPKRVRDG